MKITATLCAFAFLLLAACNKQDTASTPQKASPRLAKSTSSQSTGGTHINGFLVYGGTPTASCPGGTSGSSNTQHVLSGSHMGSFNGYLPFYYTFYRVSVPTTNVRGGSDFNLANRTASPLTIRVLGLTPSASGMVSTIVSCRQIPAHGNIVFSAYYSSILKSSYLSLYFDIFPSGATAHFDWDYDY